MIDIAQNAPLFDIDFVLQATGGTVLKHKENYDKYSIYSVVIDSRKAEEGSLFVALKGAQNDGHDYIEKAIENKASAVFLNCEKIQEFLPMAQDKDCVFIAVKDTLIALQTLARKYLDLFKILRIGITGSSGKTTTRRLVASILSQKYNVAQTLGNYNSETGLPLSIFSIRSCHNVGVFELGMNKVGEMLAIASVLRPTIAIVTNIGTAHIGILKTKDNIAREKKHIFDNFDAESVAILPKDDSYSSYLSQNVPGKKIYCSIADNERIKLVKDCGLLGSVFSVDGVEIKLNLCGKHNYLDCKLAVALAMHLGLSSKEIKRGVESITAEDGRGRVLKQRYTIIDDCYNANAESMEASLLTYKNMAFSGKKFFVIADMLELGSMAEKAHCAIVRLCKSFLGITVYFVGENMANACDNCLVTERVYNASTSENLKEIANDIKQKAHEGDMILLKGSNGMALGRMLDFLQGECSA